MFGKENSIKLLAKLKLIMRSTFNILFYVNRSKESKGTVPVMGRITINGTMAQFSCKCRIDEKLWDTKRNMAIGKSRASQQTNSILDDYRSRIIHNYQMLSHAGKHVTARQLKEKTLDTGNGYKTILCALDDEIRQFSRRVGVDRARKTLQKMEIVRTHVEGYIRIKYSVSDLWLQETDLEFIKGFHKWLLYEKKLASSTVWVYCTFLKKIMNIQVNEGNMECNPFSRFRITHQVKEREFLTEGELKLLLEYTIEDHKLMFAKEMFIFCCFTGLSFIDLKFLSPHNIVSINNEKWIISRRIKNRMPYQIKLMGIPMQILEKYGRTAGDQVFEMESYGNMHRYLKSIGAKCLDGEKKVTFHIARHYISSFYLKTSNLQN